MHIPAILTHPEIMGPPLERGIRYGHHFVVELISDGRRLWAVASEEGKNVIHQIAHGIDPSADIPEAVTDQSGTGGEANPNEAGTGTTMIGADPSANAALGAQAQNPNSPPAAPQPDTGLPPGNKAGEPPVTTVSSATSFDS